MAAKSAPYGTREDARPLDERGSRESGGRADAKLTRGRTAQKPEDIPAKGWWDITWRVFKRIGTDNVTLVSGGLAMYALLSVFPGLAAAVSIYGMFATPGDVIKHMSAFAGVLPPGVWDIFQSQLQSITQHEQSTLSIAAVMGVLIALWSARSAMSALMTATNVAYGEREKRSFVRQVLTSLVLTVGAVVGFLAMLALGIVIPVALKVIGLSNPAQWAADLVQWALLWAFAAVGLAFVYRYAPARQPARWRWVSWGSAIAAVGLAFVYRYAPARQPARWRWVSWGSAIAATLWLGASALFAIYVRTFAHYGQTYGALGGVIALLMWFYVSSLIVVVGAEINAEMERQTEKDTTEGPSAPLGERGAYAADTVGPAAKEGGDPHKDVSSGHKDVNGGRAKSPSKLAQQ